MRVLTLTNAYPPHCYGGYELTCDDVMRRFRRAGVEVTVLTSTARVPGVADIDEPDVHRVLHAYWDWERHQARAPRSPIGRYAIERHNVRAVEHVIDAVQPDVVSVWHHGGLSMSILTMLERRRLPMLLTVANEWLAAAPLLDGWTRVWVRRGWPMPASVAGVPVRLPTLRQAQANFVSDFVKRWSNEHARWRFPDAPVVRPGVDLDDFPICSDDDAVGSEKPWQWRLLYVGRIDPPKGLATLVRALPQLPGEATLDVIGSGNHSHRAELEQLAEALGLAGRVRFGTARRAQLRERYAAADVVVFPSEWDEPFGVVPLEAMASGTPVVATGTGGSAEFLADGRNCLLYPRGDVDALAARLHRLAAEPRTRAALVSGGRATAAVLTTDAYAQRLLALHEACAAGAAG